MKTSDEKRWERVQQALVAEFNGDKPVRVSSTRTLFGIKSHVDEVIEQVAAEHNEECEQRLNEERVKQQDSNDEDSLNQGSDSQPPTNQN